MALAEEIRLTVEDYLAMPEGGPRYQLVEGELIPMAPAPNRRHQRTSANLFSKLDQHVRGSRCGTLYFAPFDVVFDDFNVLQPDLIYISKARSSILTDAGATGAPDLVVEILSPSTAKLDLHRKRAIYARHGVDEMWVVDPEAEEVRVYRFAERPDRPVVIHYKGDHFSSRHFPGLEILVDSLFED